MKASELKRGMKVGISKDIRETTRVLSSNSEMASMAGNGKDYEIQDIRTHTSEKIKGGRGKIVEMRGYVWMPCDLFDPSISIPDGEYVTVKGKKVMFDPSEL